MSPSASCIPVAQYLRVSTEHRQYSFENQSGGSPGASHSRLNECEEVGVDLVGMRRWHPVWQARIRPQRTVFQELD